MGRPFLVRRLCAGVVALSAISLALVGCSSDNGSSSGTTTPADVVVVAPGGMVFDQPHYSVTRHQNGFVVAFENRDGMSHSVAFRDRTGKLVGSRILVGPHKAGRLPVRLPAGDYALICDVPGHEAAGMVSTITVT
jgi:uncharacterized cupredoxin-like copper-binding protein